MTNADPYEEPFGCLAVQLPPSCAERLRAACAAREAARVLCQAKMVPGTSANVVASVEGSEPSLPAVVVMTPRSGWGPCAGERGPGLLLLLEAFGRVAAAKTRRTVLFLASSGHELGHQGLHHFLDELQHEVFAWLHLGANIGVRLPKESPVLYQASDASLEALLVGALKAAGRGAAAPLVPVGSRPGGEAREVHDRGGRFLSLIGFNPFFHHPKDTFPEAIDLALLLDVSAAASGVALALADAAPEAAVAGQARL